MFKFNINLTLLYNKIVQLTSCTHIFLVSS